MLGGRGHAVRVDADRQKAGEWFTGTMDMPYWRSETGPDTADAVH